MRIKCHFLILLLQAFVASSLAQDADGKATSGEPKYRNTGLGFELTLPRDWYLADAKDLEFLADEAGKELKEGYKLSNTAVLNQARIEKIAFGISKKRMGATKNSAFGFSTMKQPSEDITSVMVAQSTKEFTLAEPNNKLAKDISIRRIDGRDFAEFDMIVTSALGRQNVRVLIVNLKGYSLTFALTYWDELDDLKLMMSSIESTRFLP